MNGSIRLCEISLKDIGHEEFDELHSFHYHHDGQRAYVLFEN